MSDDRDEPHEDARTVFVPQATGLAPGASTPAKPPPADPPPAPAAPAAAPASPGRVQVGSVLNHIYEVTRFVARGGMGEVFEGVNVNSDERVAIKVMLPQLAADPNVQEMFRKEARTLTRLSHPAVVQYRLLAQEPQLGVLYIVTEFIDGASLSDVLHRLNPAEADLRLLLRRLAEGLRAAHELGAVHRDISPDNVLLPDGRLDRAKIIDFGIAKDLDPSKATIVGDGFAGKLGYVAPEQFGDFGRQIGPWTDIYSLGLVMLAAASGRDVDMGATLVEAIDKRRAGPDLSAAPPGLRPVFEGMLKADPAERFRSMDEVLAAMDGAPVRAAEAKTVWAPQQPAAPAPAKAPAAEAKPSPAFRPPLALMIGGGVAAAVLLGLIVALALPRHPHPAAGAGAGAPAAAASAPSGVPQAEVARRAVEGALASIPCSWLDLESVTDQPGGVALKLAGVAGAPARAQEAITRAAGAAGVRVVDANMDDDVAPVGVQTCAALDAFRSFRNQSSESGRRLTAAQHSFVMTRQPDNSLRGDAVIDLQVGDPSLDFSLLGIDPGGAIQPLYADRKAFDQYKEKYLGQTVSPLGHDSYRIKIGMTPPPGWNGLLLITGKGPFHPSLLAAPLSQRGADWAARLQRAAQQGGWKADMVWYKTTAPG